VRRLDAAPGHGLPSHALPSHMLSLTLSPLPWPLPQWATYLTNNAAISLFWVTMLRNGLVLFYTTHIGAWWGGGWEGGREEGGRAGARRGPRGRKRLGPWAAKGAGALAGQRRLVQGYMRSRKRARIHTCFRACTHTFVSTVLMYTLANTHAPQQAHRRFAAAHPLPSPFPPLPPQHILLPGPPDRGRRRGVPQAAARHVRRRPRRGRRRRRRWCRRRRRWRRRCGRHGRRHHAGQVHLLAVLEVGAPERRSFQICTDVAGGAMGGRGAQGRAVSAAPSGSSPCPGSSSFPQLPSPWHRVVPSMPCPLPQPLFPRPHTHFPKNASVVTFATVG
jgi:hypothetical protein